MSSVVNIECERLKCSVISFTFLSTYITLLHSKNLINLFFLFQELQGPFGEVKLEFFMAHHQLTTCLKPNRIVNENTTKIRDHFNCNGLTIML